MDFERSRNPRASSLAQNLVISPSSITTPWANAFPDHMTQERQTIITRDHEAGTITKAIKPLKLPDYRGIDRAKKWPRERVYNEAAALQFIKKRTTIPVPAVIDVGEGPNGFFVTTELIDGVPLAEIGDKCQLPSLHGHQPARCRACKALATMEAITFIEEVVLPQFSELKSHTTGFNGVVIPPPWVTEMDRRGVWKTKTSATPEFVFCHGDLGPFNIMIDPLTLTVEALLDLENGGFFPPVFLDQWAVDTVGYVRMYKTMHENPTELAKLVRALEP